MHIISVSQSVVKADSFVITAGIVDRSRHLVNGFQPPSSTSDTPQGPHTVKSEPGRRYMVSATRVNGQAQTRLGAPVADRPTAQQQQTSESVFHVEFDTTSAPPDVKFVRVNANWTTWPCLALTKTRNCRNTSGLKLNRKFSIQPKQTGCHFVTYLDVMRRCKLPKSGGR